MLTFNNIRNNFYFFCIKCLDKKILYALEFDSLESDSSTCILTHNITVLLINIEKYFNNFLFVKIKYKSN